jgi:hypothetical protein
VSERPTLKTLKLTVWPVVHFTFGREELKRGFALLRFSVHFSFCIPTKKESWTMLQKEEEAPKTAIE